MHRAAHPPGDPGDILVLPTSSGFLLARRRNPLGPGPWWHYIITVETFPVAVRLAQDFAYALGRRAWIQEPAGEYREVTEISQEPSPPVT